MRLSKAPTTLTLFLLTASALFGTGCGGSNSSGGVPSPPALTYSASTSAASLSFTATVGVTGATQNVTLTNTGTGPLTFTSATITGANATLFTEKDNCGSTLAAGSSCSATILFTPTGSGASAATLSFSDNATAGPQTVPLTGTASAVPVASSIVDCSTTSTAVSGVAPTGGPCAALPIQGDPPAAGGFHGYADPSMRADPNSSVLYLAYSWAHTLSDGTRVVDLHLASSTDAGASFTEVGPLYQSTQSTQTTSNAYNSVNDSSTETIDLLPIALTGSAAGETLWVQAHQAYLVKPEAGIYDQLDATAVVSVSAVQLSSPAGAGAGSSLLALGSAPEARLGTMVTAPNRNLTQDLATLNSNMSKCGNFGQPALWYQGTTLFLALECTEVSGGGNIDSNELAHFLFATTPSGADASSWTWSYVAEFATGAQAAALGSTAGEGKPYAFFTEPEFVLSKSGQLFILLTPAVFFPAGSQQPVIQYGCRAVPVTDLSSSGIVLATDATTGALSVDAKVTESDLYVSPNEGPAACTYEPKSTDGIVMGRKYENYPGLGFFIFPVDSAVNP